MASVADTGDQTPPQPPETIVVVKKRGIGWRIAKWTGIVLATIVALLAAFLLWLNTDSGRGWIVERINELEFASGLKIKIDRIDGSIWSEMTVHGLTLSDSEGEFFTAEQAAVDYSPLSYLRGSHIDIASLAIPRARLARTPALRSTSTDPNAPLIPDLLLDIHALRVDRLELAEAVTGQRHVLSINGGIHLLNSELRTNLRVVALAEPGLAGGDSINLALDAAPEADRLGIELQVDAPGNGFVASMTGIAKRLRADIRGAGTWADWTGKLRAALDEDGFADLNIRAQDGRFALDGPLRPDLFMEGPVQRLTGPYTQFRTVFTYRDSRLQFEDFRLNSRAAAIVMEGGFDLARSEFQDLGIAARLIEPGAIAPNLGGRDVRLALILNGAMSTPRVAYDLRAATISFGERSLVNFRARGAARVDADRIVVPISATADRLDGLPEQVGGLLTNVRLDGDLLIEGTNILSDNLRLRSDRADAVLALAFDLGRGRYNVGIQGRINDFLIQSVGVVDITSDFDVVSQGGGFGLQGRVAVRTRRIFNQTAVDLLGGMATATASIGIGGDGVIRVGDVRLTAPQLRITDGGGAYYPDGRIALQLRGTSTRYGAIAVNIGGTIAAPQIRLEVAEAGFGVGLRGITATVSTTAEGYAVRASGQSNYGPFEADVVILARAGPMTIRVNRLLFAGMTFAGTIQQSAAGPFAGRLTVTGPGTSGAIVLSAAGARQRVEIDATAVNAVIPSTVAGGSDIVIGRAIIDLDITLPVAGDPFALYAGSGRVEMAGVRSGAFAINEARADLNYSGREGSAAFVARGTSGVPFDVAGRATLTPERIRLSLQGTANNIPFRFSDVAVIEFERGDWVLRPTTILFRDGQGSMRLAGKFGTSGTIIQSRLDSFDIAIANTIRPGLGVNGTATGSLDFYLPTGGGFPRAEARLNIRNFTRTGIAMRSVPVDISLSGNLRPEGGALAAVFRQGQAVIGRMQAQLTPLPPGSGTWTDRMFAAPLGGGIRYNGPASVLVSLAGLSGHELQGPVAIGVDFRGRVNDPELQGVARAQNVTYTNQIYGTRITNLVLDGRFSGSSLEIGTLTGRAGDGTLSVNGSVGFASDANYPISLDIALDNARLARSDDIAATATGTLFIRNTAAERATIRGELQLGEIRYQIVRNASSRVVNLSGICRRGSAAAAARALPEGAPVIPTCGEAPRLASGDQLQQQAAAAAAAATPVGKFPTVWRLNLDLVADNRIFVSGMGLESEWAANLQVRGTSAAPILTGGIDLVRGTLSFAGRRFILDDQSRIDFAGGAGGSINPQIAIIANAEIDDVTVSVNVDGSAGNPRIAFSSNPNLPQDEVVSRILFGSSVTEISAIQAIQLAASLNSLRGGSGGLDPLGALQNATGIQRLRILGEDDTTGRGTALAAGFYLSDDIYIEIITDAKGFTATQLEFSLSRTLSLLSQFGTQSGTNVNLRYSRDY